MPNYTAAEIEFRTIYQQALGTVAEASGCPGMLRQAYYHGYMKGNPKYALVILRRLLDRSAQVAAQLRDLDARVLAAMPEIEAMASAQTEARP